jgi:uncharacterized protein with GYD domain
VAAAGAIPGGHYRFAMPTFMMLSILGPDGFATVRDNPARILAVNEEVEAMGARVLHQYALLGQWDFMSVIEAPDDRTMIRITSTLAARGTLKTHTLGAIPIDAYIEALGDGVGGGESPRVEGPSLTLDFDG